MTHTPASPHAPVRPDWLAAVKERPLDPQRVIVDPHHHLWDRPGQRYLGEELLEDVEAGHQVVATVYVQCRSMYDLQRPEALQPVGEVRFATEVAKRSPRGIQLCAGIVGGANLRLGHAVAPVLDEMIEVSEGRLCGIRNATAWHADPTLISNPMPPPGGILLDPSFSQGVSRLTERNLTLDIWAYHTQLAEVIQLAQQHPDQQIILDHAGGPLGAGPYRGKQVDVMQAWDASLRTLAECPNVQIKLGGLGMRVNGFDLDQRASPPDSCTVAELWGPYLLRCIEIFGVERCMFESNFPVDKGMVSYGVLWNAFKRITAHFSEDEKNALFSRNAARTYKLDETWLGR
ncbi:amidohydrolase [Pseudomonas sp. GD03842]|uniref:amidohydrolase family protein n=1 Tax=Pseudomonas sp. GD03842 TaxID=2975385 RepID=UPI002449472F|nr:amidohydrolase family protein [Pseudomonas sp. GD03842]MDH0745187.1 amidohydrolase [Pseudomonas sp. GD03842]